LTWLFEYTQRISLFPDTISFNGIMWSVVQ